MDEVWFATVSHSGGHIASFSKDRTGILWEHIPPSTFRAAHVLVGHTEPCLHAAWSPDDQHLLTASGDKTVRLWCPPRKTSVRVFTKHTDSVTSVGWLHDCKRFVSAGLDRCIYLWSVDGTELYRWEIPSRVQDVGITHDGTRMLVVNSDRNLKVIDIMGRRELPALPEGDAVTSFCASQLRDEVLVNIAQQVSVARQTPVIRLWDINARRVVQRYMGHFQGRFVVRSCFAGAFEEFVISGSEDGQVYIWHRQYGSLLEVIQGHSATVNSVCWCNGISSVNGTAQRSSAFLISASDDSTLKIWSADAAPHVEAAATSCAGESSCGANIVDINESVAQGDCNTSVLDAGNNASNDAVHDAGGAAAFVSAIEG